MTYSDALFFIGKCLTLGRYPERIESVRDTIRSGVVEWERIVWLSTSQLIFPAVHLQLKRAGLLEELPADLVEYMEEFTSVNRGRNQKIINQVSEITTVLKEQGLAPIFLKGTANLLDGLYEDMGERMMGDIDVLISENQIPLAIDVLKKDGYYLPAESDDDYYPGHLHFPPLVKDGMPAAIEVHRWAVRKPYNKVFCYDLIAGKKKKVTQFDGAFVMSEGHKIIHNMLVVQMNDKGYLRGQIYLRQMYDLLLLSKNGNPMKIADGFGRYFNRFNAYLAITTVLFGKPDCLGYAHTRQARFFLWRARIDITYPRFSRLYNAVISLFFQFYNYLNQTFRSVFNKQIRMRLFRKLKNPDWYKKHFSGIRERL